MQKQKQKLRGFTLIETMIVVAILGIILAIAIPNFVNMINAAKLKSSIDQIKNDLVFAKNEALKQNKNTYFKITKTSATNWCIGISTLDTCDCKTAIASCNLFTRTDSNAQLLSDTLHIKFDNIRTLPTPVTGTMPATIMLARGNGNDEKNAAVHINHVGRTSICSPTADKALAGIPAC